MTTGRTGGAAGGRPGAAARRVLLAVVASALVTLAVAGPMGYQAFEARRAEPAGADTYPPAQVLPTDDVRDTSVLWATAWGVSRGLPLDRAVLSGRVVVYVDLPEVLSVTFRLDPTARGARLDRTDARGPLTLVSGRTDDQAGTYDTRHLADGDHRIDVLFTFRNGRTMRDIVVFTVHNG
jgi:hypothetical protein